MKKGESVISIKGLTVKKEGKEIIKDITLEVKKGELLYIIGPNGAGKSTFIKAILGLEKYSGEIRIFGKKREELSKEELKKIGYLPQLKNINLDFPINVEEVITCFEKKDEKRMERLLETFKIEGIRDRVIKGLSLGQLQRVFIVRALIDDPELIIFDEPDSSLDVEGRRIFFSYIKKLKKEGKTILIVTHDLGVIREESSVLCIGKVSHFHGGRDVLTKENLEEVYGCPIEMITHEKIPHRVLLEHKEGEDGD